MCEGMNLVQIRHMRSFKAYVCKVNTEMNATPKMDKFPKKCIFLGEVAKVGG